MMRHMLTVSLTLHEFSEALALLRVKLRREQTYRLFKCFDQVTLRVTRARDVRHVSSMATHVTCLLPPFL